MKVCLYTLGCKVNQYESGGLHKELQDRGFEVCDSLEPADIYIINT
ncbi:MAG: tRNA (N(6)-L-threonylcarbamoyladenosine(37)-C(2))-methylthiotransferase MtaB, partial [Clostridia bacterium]